MDSTAMTDHHGPQGSGRMMPGRRATVLVVVPGSDQDQALRESMGWVAAFEEDCGLVMDRSATELYAVARAADLKRPLMPPRETTPSLEIDFICVGGRWFHPDDCPPCPPDTNGATAWAWAYYQLIMGAEDDSLCTLWDLMPLPAMV